MTGSVVTEKLQGVVRRPLDELGFGTVQDFTVRHFRAARYRETVMY